MKAWVYVEDGIVKAAMIDSMDRETLAQELGEWVLEGITPVLHDFGDEPIRINAPLPEKRQAELFL